MKSLKIIGIVAIVVGWLAIGLFVAKGPQPEIVLPAEKLWKIGPLNITNTLLTSWIVMAILIVISFLATRTLNIIPSGLQNFVEAVVGFLVDQIEDIAGQENGRRFFTVVATIFLFIIVSNWFGLMPFFNAIGKAEDINHHVFEEIADHQAHDTPYDKTTKYSGVKMDNTAGMTVAKSGAKTYDFKVQINEKADIATDRYIVFLAKTFTKDFPAAEDEAAPPSAEEVQRAVEALKTDPDAPKLTLVASGGHDEHGASGHVAITSKALGQDLAGVTFPGQKLALVIPYFRSTFSDVNNTLAMGIVAFIVVEFWGFQSLGIGYLKKFFNINGINSFVGILELLSEFIRIISFAFRLFGNIFAGEVLVLMLTFLMPFLFVDVIYMLELFVGFIQAAVFALLTLVFAIGAVEHHGEDDHEAHDDHGGAHADIHHQAGAVQAHT
ncbi:MAG: F0F1 ATP synthase subunit A [Dehalococcoidia bacterium]|nr:F0F1 ATP synthase subunit A [Dehalococcoidia bacterium]